MRCQDNSFSTTKSSLVLPNLRLANSSNYSERLYSKVYYSIRSLCGLLAKNSFQDFSWDVFKERFVSDFGKVEEKRYSLEQLLEFAFRKFGKTK
ncbi:MAG: hypothetical protein AAFW70_25395, partial [Cyanobacteria bacterium J06635_10]